MIEDLVFSFITWELGPLVGNRATLSWVAFNMCTGFSFYFGLIGAMLWLEK
jgi:hypothetical protein